jgi:TRAP-type uncharacterized transport system substrate-binding protein
MGVLELMSLFLVAAASAVVTAVATRRSERPAGPILRLNSPPKSFWRRLGENWTLFVLGLLSLLLLGAGIWTAYLNLRTVVVTIAVEDSHDETVILLEAVKALVARSDSNIRINLRHSQGTAENLRLLESGAVQMATALSAASAGPHARLVADLFETDLQLIAPAGSATSQFSDLKGKRIGLPKGSSAYQTFLLVADHFGLNERDFNFVGGNSDRADQAFERGEVDARFDVRPLHGSAAGKLLSAGKATLLPIDPEIRFRKPAFEPAVISKGAYSAVPLVPSADVATLALRQLLLARDDADDRAVRTIAALLAHHRHEISSAIPVASVNVRTLVSQISRPDAIHGVITPIHSAAASSFDAPRPSLIAGDLGLWSFLGIAFVLAVLWIAELRRAFERTQRRRADPYNIKVIALMSEARTALQLTALDPIETELMVLGASAVADLQADRLSDGAFQSVQLMLLTAFSAIRDRRDLLQDGPAARTTEAETQGTNPWAFSRFLQVKSS